MKKIVCYIIVFAILLSNIMPTHAKVKEYECEAKSVVLMEASSGKVMLEKAKDEKLSPASITKIMTLILIYDELNAKKIKLSDMVTTSAYAKSMGGSQVFLEEGEQQSVETLIKCIVIASGNDACVAMAEHIAGSEEKFVEMMNERARKLGMKNTNFIDCCGLTDSDEHYTSAYDVALMSRELINRYPKILDYSSIWMETIIHNTKQGSKEFVLSNTNKLLKIDENVKGLKTGSTSKAKYCVSNVAIKNNIKIIAVVMAAPDYKQRFAISEGLLKYGYANCILYADNKLNKKSVNITNGEKNLLKVKKQPFSYVCNSKEDMNSITKKVNIDKNISAPIKKGDTVGCVNYYYKNKKIGTSLIVANENVKKITFIKCFVRMVNKYISL